MLIAGIILLVLAGLAALVAYGAGGALKMLASTKTVACNAVVAGEACEVVGGAQPIDGKPLKGPASGRDCVWFKLKVTQHWTSWVSSTSGGYNSHDSKVVEDKQSDEPFAIRDASGQVFVNPKEADVDTPVGSHTERRDVNDFLGGGGALEVLVSGLDRRTDEEIEVEEWILPVGEELLVRGKPTKADIGLTMLKPDDGEFLVSTHSEHELVESAKRDKAFGNVFAAVAGVAGVALIVADALS